MFEIIKNKTSRPSHTLFVNGKLFSEKLFLDEKDGGIHVDGFPEFDIEEIAEMKAEQFPDNFKFNFTSTVFYEHAFDLFTIYRKDNLIEISMWASLDSNNSEEWLLWHPVRFIKKAQKIAKKKGYKAPSLSYHDGDALLIYMDFEVKSTIGELFNKAITQLHELLAETDKEMWKSAVSDN